MAFTLDSRRKQRFDFMRALYDKAEGSETGLIYLEELAEEIHLSEIETEIIAIYLADEGLIRIRMRNIVSITHQGIDEVETILADPDKATQHFPPLHTFASPHDHFQHSAGPIPSRQEYVRPQPPPPPSPAPPAAAAEPEPSPDPSKEELEALELKNICEAIGLDPGEFAGDLAHVPAMLGDASLGSGLGSPLRQEISGNPAGMWPRSYSDDLLAGSLPAMPPPVSTRPQDLAGAAEPPPAASIIAETLASLKLRLLKLRLAPEDMAEAQAEIDTVVAQLFSSRPKQQIITASLNTLLAIFYRGGAPLLTDDVEHSLAKIRAYLRQS